LQLKQILQTLQFVIKNLSSAVQKDDIGTF